MDVAVIVWVVVVVVVVFVDCVVVAATVDAVAASLVVVYVAWMLVIFNLILPRLIRSRSRTTCGFAAANATIIDCCCCRC